MGKKLGVKRNRGKKFVYKEKETVDIPKKVKSKSIFRDKRLGEKNENLGKEEKYLIRFQKERELVSRRNQKFELDDTITLTHKGVKLEDLADDYVEDYDVVQSDEEDLEKPKKHQKIDDDLVNEEHFGMGGGHKSKKDAYAEIIEKSKQHKMLRQKEKDENNEIMRDIDMNLGEITQKLKFKDKTRPADEDEYDKLIDEIRMDNTLHSANVISEETAEILEKKEELEKLGENWEIPQEYEEFAQKMGKKPLESLEKMKLWNKAYKRASRDKLQKILEHSLRFLALNWDLEKEFKKNNYDEIIKFFYELCKDYPYASEQTCLELTTELGKELSLNLIAFFHISGLLFDINLADTLSSILTDMASQLFIYFPFLDKLQTRNFLLLAKVYIDIWLTPNNFYSPECTRGLLRVFQNLGQQPYNEEFNLKLLFSDLTDSNLHTMASDLFTVIQKSFSNEPAFSLILSQFLPFLDKSLNISCEPVTNPIKFKIEKPQEIETFEPFILDRITSVKQAKDPNKVLTETDKLKMQTKKATKLTKKVLQKETEVEVSEKFTENKLRQQGKEQKQNKVRSMLDEMQAEYKKLQTTNELKKEKKKRKGRMAGNKTESHR
ncbi:unnamed protein product [Blepharisma stoltei]|uniref:Nucleolar protein 14 n=1 Tax=Blepharisma stoltei TaxID=1481888 RepID=A0AAU9KI77_9CILI|nr:unnamed protein product [Blepharisma stoltei]